MSENLSGPRDGHWNALYVVGAVAALLTVVNGLAEMAISFFPGGHVSPIALSAVDWFTLYRDSPFMGMRNLGLLNVFFTVLSILVMYALYAAHRRTHATFAGLSLLVAMIGAAVFFAGNRAFPMLALSRQYALAATDAQRAALGAAGEAMLAVGQSHTAGTFLAFGLSTVAGVGISIVMLRAGLFSRACAILGIVGFSLLLVFEITADFAPAFPATLVFALTGGPLSLVWDVLVARGLFRLARQPYWQGP